MTTRHQLRCVFSIPLARESQIRSTFVVGCTNCSGTYPQVFGAGFGHPSAAPLFAGLTFNIGCHSRVALAGANGSGKSTLLGLLAKRHELTAGEVDHHSRLRLAVFDQHFEETLPMHLSATAHLQQVADSQRTRDRIWTLSDRGPRYCESNCVLYL